jgi:murein DD-endopeptidase MepM/ murein hydrolase activator NlpD
MAQPLNLLFNRLRISILAHGLHILKEYVITTPASKTRLTFLWLSSLVLAGLACNYPTTSLPASSQIPPADLAPSDEVAQAGLPTSPATRAADEAYESPTPDAPHAQPTIQTAGAQYIVQANDTLAQIAERFGVRWEDLSAANQLINPNQLEIGQVINIPPISPGNLSADFKIIPDSELVYGPASAYLDIAAFAEAEGGYLSRHREEADGRIMSGPEIVAKVATEYSVNPKLLLALLEMQSGWLRDSNPRTNTLDFPMGYSDSRRIGLFRQLSWAADQLNEGYYQWKSDLLAGWNTKDGTFIPASPTLNAGSAAVQKLLAQVYNEAQWRKAIAEEGFFAIYTQLFGYPFDFAIEPWLPTDISQPALQLPFEDGVPWVYSGGPHGGWGLGSAWAALDFAPRGDQLGCNESADWVVAAADGLIIRADNGAVVQDLDGDGYEQTGWTILYMHVAENERVRAGQTVLAGERIGHPSCEGGLASASHLHIARRYNGEWIPAYGDLPFVMDSWLSLSEGILYDGFLQRNDQIVEACECRDPSHMLQR